MQADDEIKRKLSEMFNNYESEPQVDTWEKIRASVQLSQMFQEYEAEPEAESWEKIRAGIDLNQKFRNYEAEPEPETWDKIRAGVDLAQMFQHYEAEPEAISWLKIQEAIQPKKRRRGIFIPLFYRVGIAAGLVLLLGSLWWLLNTTPDNSTTAANSTSGKGTQGSGKKANQNPPITKDTKIELAEQPTKNSVSADKNSSDNKATGNNKFNKLPKNNNAALLAEKANRTHNKKESNTGSEVSTNENAPEKLISNIDRTTDVSEETSVSLTELDSKPFQPKAIRKPFGAIAYNNEKPYQEKEQKVYRKLILTASLMPLQTYQAFTILPQTSTYIQQVGRLDPIDNQRLGVQLRGGVMKPLSNRFSVGASATYTGVQQWANYEINNGDYELQTADNGSYTLVGIDKQVAQKQFLQTLGIKLDNAYLVMQKKSKLYVIGGAEAVHVLNNKEFGYYINASVGLSYPVKGGKSLWVEPTFRYGLSQSFDANNYLKIRPYNIGLNFRINFI